MTDTCRMAESVDCEHTMNELQLTLIISGTVAQASQLLAGCPSGAFRLSTAGSRHPPFSYTYMTRATSHMGDKTLIVI